MVPECRADTTPSSARRTRSASGIRAGERHERAAPRGEISRPAPSSSTASRAASAIARSCTLAHPARSSVSIATKRRRECLGAQRERVEAPSVLVQLGVQACAGVRKVAIAAPAHAQALAQRGRRRRACPTRPARTATSARRPHRRRSPSELTSTPHGPHSLAPSSSTGTSTRRARGSDAAGHPADVRARNQPRLVSDRFGDLLNGATRPTLRTARLRRRARRAGPDAPRRL